MYWTHLDRKNGFKFELKMTPRSKNWNSFFIVHRKLILNESRTLEGIKFQNFHLRTESERKVGRCGICARSWLTLPNCIYKKWSWFFCRSWILVGIETGPDVRTRPRQYKSFVLARISRALICTTDFGDSPRQNRVFIATPRLVQGVRQGLPQR